MVWVLLAQALWFMIPAYVANPAAVLTGGGTPMDFGRTASSGARILGDGKTWRGFFGGVGAAVFIGLLQQAAAVATGTEAASFTGTTSMDSFPPALGILLTLAVGSLLGDVLGSFVKRRLGIPRGARARGLDQYDFLLGTFLFLALFQTAWLLEHYLLGDAVFGLALVILITPLLHKGVNVLGYKLGRKDVPW